MRDQGAQAQSMWGGIQAAPGQPVKGTAPAQPAPGVAPHGNVPTPVQHPEVTTGPAPAAPPALGTPPPANPMMGIPTGEPGALPPTTPGAPAPPPQSAQPPPALPGAGTSAPRPGPVPPGTQSPSGTPVGPDGGYTNPDGSKDWMPGYGPQMSFGGQEIKTGKAPTTPAPPDPDTATGGARGTPAWRQAYAAHDAWIRSQLDAGLHLSDLGLTPTRGGGLSDYMKYGSYQPQGGTPAAGAPRTPGDPNQGNTPVTNGPPVAGAGGGLPGTVPGSMSYGGNNLQAALMQLLMQGQGQ